MNGLKKRLKLNPDTWSDQLKKDVAPFRHDKRRTCSKIGKRKIYSEIRGTKHNTHSIAMELPVKQEVTEQFKTFP